MHACACSEASFLVEMATVLEECIWKSSVLLCIFYGQKDSIQRLFTKKTFAVYSGKCLSCKPVHKWVEICGKLFAEVETEVRKWLRQQSRRLLCCGF
jgi:hypothetical protein